MTEPATRPGWRSSRALFVRGLGLVCVLAFASLAVQVEGLIGERGLVPVADRFETIRETAGEAPVARLPSLLWLDAGDATLLGLCAAGAVLGLLALLDVAPAPALLGCGVAYLSLVHGGYVFLQFQWDSLLVECCALGALYAPWRWGRGGGRDPEPPALARWLVWWLLFRFMFESGVVKLTWGDEAWTDLTAMTFHYMTQPLPHPASLTAYRLPTVVHQASTLAMFVIELGLPFAILAPRRVRHGAALGLLSLQVLIAATGNYGFFNLLSALLCLTLVDDRALGAWRRVLRRRRDAMDAGTGAAETGGAPDAASTVTPARRRARRVQAVAAGLFAVVPVVVGGLHLTQLTPDAQRPPLDRDAGFVATLTDGGAWAGAAWLERRVSPFLLVNPYGLFRVMTKTRPEILIEGLPDGAEPDDESAWLPYPFRWKPGHDLSATPRWCQPHMPRLDWRLWFEALAWEDWTRRGGRLRYDGRASPWFQWVLARLLDGEPAVLDLFADDPFDGRRPRAVRARLVDRRFATADEQRETGAVWVQTPLPTPPLVFGPRR